MSVIRRESATVDRQWRAVLERRPDADGVFVYAVRSTRIYCRPTCPSRRPRREQVLFFDAPAAAEQAGFRACRRCRPSEAITDSRALKLVRRVCRAIEEEAGAPPTLASLARAEGLTPHHLLRTFKRATGITPREYADARRMERVRGHLRNGRAITTAIYDTGFSSSSRLYERAPLQLGMTPASYKRGGRGEQVSFAIVPTSLGRLLVAATARGVCRVSLGDGDAALERALRAELPHAELLRDDATLARSVAAIVAYIDGDAAGIALPLDIRATAFQRRVWKALLAIPRGETRSYAEVASAIGAPRATRAVARACAMNPVPLVIPCHRVVRSDGGIGGYALGVARKEALLRKERA